MNNEEVKLQWHPAFCAAARLEFCEDMEALEFFSEYKCPGDAMSIDDFYKTVAYACMYKALGEQVNAIRADELTISMVREAYPAGMVSMLRAQGIEIEKVYDGIYYLRNFLSRRR